MNIAIVCYPTFGGSGVVATELGVVLANQGHKIHFVTYKQPVRLEILSDNLFFHEVIVPSYPLFHYQPYELVLSNKLVEVALKYKIDVIHVHYAIPHAYAAYMTKQMLADQGVHIPIVTTLHGTDITLVGSHPLYKPAVTFSINNSDKVTSVSESLKKDTIKKFGVKKEIEVIPNFVDFDKRLIDSNLCNRSLIANEEERIVTHISNFRPVKRIMDVIKIFEKISCKVSAKLLLIGDGPEKQKALDYCVEKQLMNKVKFLGNSTQIYEILCYSDLMLLPSETESFGLVALEAMMMGTPVIASNVGGLPEVIENGLSGFLCEVGDIDKMAEKGIEVLHSVQILHQFKEHSKKVAKSFDIKRVIPKYIDLYSKII